MKLSEINAMLEAFYTDMKSWPVPKNGDELAEQYQREFEGLPRVKYADLPVSIKDDVRQHFPVDRLRNFLNECMSCDEELSNIPEKDIERIMTRTRNTATYVIERKFTDDNKLKLSPVLYGNYAIAAFIDALNQYKKPHAPILRRDTNTIIKHPDSWMRYPAAKMPNSPLTYFLARIMNAGVEGPKASRINRNEKIGIASNPAQNAIQYTRKVKDHEDVITVYDPTNTLKGGGKAIGKLFFFMLQCWAYSGYGREFTFPLQFLIDLGMYNSIDAARLAVKNFMGRQGQINLSRTTTTKKGSISNGGIVFYNYQIENAMVTISVNDKMPMQLLAEFFTIMPLFAYRLSMNAFNIVNYIWYRARQNCDELMANNGKFHMSIESIRQYLELPTPSEVKNYKYYEKIREPIETAIEEIEENMGQDDYHITIEPRYSNDSSINAWLNGDLEITLPEKQAKQFSEIAKREEQHYKERERAKIQAEAKAKATMAAKAKRKE